MQETGNHDVLDVQTVREISFNLSRASGWMKFLGIMMMIYGGMVALSIVGLIIAWLPIWMGILLFRAANRANNATRTGDKHQLNSSLQNINNYFTINGILLIISILIATLIMALMIFTGFAFEGLTDLLV